MSPPEPALARGMHIVWLIGVLMMVPMMRCPPQRTLLHGGTTDPRQHELKPAAGFVTAMRKVTMVRPGDTEHANHVHGQAKTGCLPTDAGPEGSEAGEMNSQER